MQTSINGQRSTNTPITLSRRDTLRVTFEARKLIGVIIGRGATPEIVDYVSFQGRGINNKSLTKDTLFPCPMPNNQQGWVLGYYIVTDIWNARIGIDSEDSEATTDAEARSELNGELEREPGTRTSIPRAEAEKGLITMLRLERWNIENKAWFAKDSPSHDPPLLHKRDYSINANSETCKMCIQESPRIFEEYFLCQNTACGNHWRVDGRISTANLTYTKTFLQKRDIGRLSNNFKPPGAMTGTHFPEVAPPFRSWVKDNHETLTPESLTAENYEAKMKVLNTGFLCPSCHMLNRRIKWHAWHCANGDCNYSHNGAPPFLLPQKLTELVPKHKAIDWKKLTVAPFKCFQYEQDCGDYTCYNYDLAYGCGISILVPKPGTNNNHKGADWLYERVFDLASDGTIPLERIITPASAEGTITNHYIVNYGKPYKLATHIKNTINWEDAPEEITYARNKINELTDRFQIRDPQGNLVDGEGEFNECYIAGYFTDNAMSWHDDGEGGLGSVVATWTLGGAGRMQIGMKTKHMYGRRGQKFIDEDLVLPGCIHETERRALKHTLDTVYAQYPNPDTNATHRAQRLQAHAQWKQSFHTLLQNVKMPAKPKPRRMLDIPLVHGSIAVMRGAKMQQLYEHKVTVETPLRLALTFRHVSPAHERKVLVPREREEYPHYPDESHLLMFVAGEWRRRAAERKMIMSKEKERNEM